MQLLNLQGFDLEYSQLERIEWRKDFSEVWMQIRSPVLGWYYKEKAMRFMRSIGLLSLLSNSCTDYLLTLEFLGVSNVDENLFSEGYISKGFDESEKQWIEALSNKASLQIEFIRNVKLDEENSRFYLCVEDLKINFNYRDCISLQKCIDIEGEK